MLNTILSTRAWALESRYFAQIKPTVLKRLQVGDLSIEVFSSEKKEDLPLPIVQGVTAAGSISAAVAFASFAAAGPNRANGDGSAEVKVAIIPLRGAMTKYGGACSYGTKDVRSWLAGAIRNPEIGAIVLLTDSPGGAVDGTEDLAKDIKNASKPIVAFVDGMAASAGYWVSSQAQEIFINSETTAWVGSIGTLIAHVDQSQFLEKQGLKVTYITADASVDKVKGNSTQPLDDESMAMFKSDLNTINDTFISYVKSGRGNRIAEQSKWDSAKVFNGKDALKLGMVDRIGTLEDAIVRAAELAQGTSSKSSKKQSSNNTPMKFTGLASKFPKLSAALGLAATQDEVEVDETVLANAELAVAAANAAKETAEASLKTAQDSLTSVTTERDTLQTKVTTLEEWKKNSKGTKAPEGDLNEDDGKVVKVSSHNQYAQNLMKRVQGDK